MRHVGRHRGLLRTVGWLLVGSGIFVAASGHYVIYSAPSRADASFATVGWALAGLCLTVVGLLLVQFRS